MVKRQQSWILAFAGLLMVPALAGAQSAGAIAGTSYPIDVEQLAKDLGFSRVVENSIDAGARQYGFVVLESAHGTTPSRKRRSARVICACSFRKASWPQIDVRTWNAASRGRRRDKSSICASGANWSEEQATRVVGVETAAGSTCVRSIDSLRESHLFGGMAVQKASPRAVR